MVEHANIGLWRKGQEAFSRRDLDTLREVYSEDVVYHFPGTHQLAGHYTGLDAVLQFLARVVAETHLHIAEVHSVMADEEHVVALIRAIANRGGKQFALDQANVYHVVDGRITEAWLLPADPVALDAFLS